VLANRLLKLPIMIKAEEFLIKINFGDNQLTKKEVSVYFDSIITHNAYINGMIEFAKFHVKEVLKQESEKVKVSDEYSNLTLIAKIDRDSILKSYSLDNIM
jgi:hypothetical protein